MQTQGGIDDATRRAWDEGPFARILRDAEAAKQRQIEAAKARPALSAAVFVDEDVSRDSVEREALKHLAATSPDADKADRLLREYAQTQLRKTFRGVDWDHLRDLVTAPATRQPPLPRPIGDGRYWAPKPKKRAARAERTPRPKIDYARLTPFPGWPAAGTGQRA